MSLSLKPEFTTSQVARIIKRNPAYRELLGLFLEQKGKTGAMRTARMVGLLGVLGTRNLFLTLRSERLFKGSFPLQTDGTIKLTNASVFSFGTEAEEMYFKNKSPHSSWAFFAGSLFDWWNLFFQAKKKKSLETYCKALSQQALKTGIVAYEWSKADRSLNVEPQELMLLIHLIFWSRLLPAWELAENQGGYANWEQKDKTGLLVAGRIKEVAKWGMAHEDIAAFHLHRIPLLKPFSSALIQYRRPEGGESPLARAASMVMSTAKWSKVVEGFFPTWAKGKNWDSTLAEAYARAKSW
jgi:hypothetical protein